MSLAKQRKPTAAQGLSMPNISLLKGLGLLAALLLTGALISILAGSIGWMYFAFLIISSLLIALIVEERGLFLSIASIPILYAVTVVTAGIFITKSNAPEGTSFSKTSLLTSVYPLVQNFVWLLIAVLGATAIGVLRWIRFRKAAQRAVNQQRISRRADMKRDRQNRAERLSVAELMARNRSENPQASSPRASRRRSHAQAQPPQKPQDRIRGRDREERRREQQAERENRLQPDPNRRAGDVIPPSPETGPTSSTKATAKKQRWDDNLYE
ncbi:MULTISPECIES: DUF6542 domain-containing protein [unclassified Corynebacterium]|uniref:DUF6542 domain-containing protein n=1 Tax=Corynebacterium TaxID=1716 RepID=UPI00254F199A|nr:MULTISPECIES: DUF6542 domain-containing protein [unclassified Corynebacterium]MDK8475569.1 hypothetical protein [Corynebacterium sp. MSK310]MDK8672124.1 hypothetical protein [Corynebacterium sp. MSK189]MDK8735447.1 hypothetical protein [Corynebacterium sp. MSK306]